MNLSQRATDMKRLSTRIDDARMRRALGLEPLEELDDLLAEASSMLSTGAIDVENLHLRKRFSR